ncbi:LexA family transcriptional regulator [Acidihalobacter prosperus]
MSEFRKQQQKTAPPENPEDWARGFTQRLRTCSKIAGSGEALAKRASIPRRTLETYLSGRAEPKVSRLIAIANAVNVSVDWLATGNTLLENPEAGEEAYYAHFPVHTCFPMQDLTNSDQDLPAEAPRPPLSFDLAWLRQEFSASPEDICAVVLGSEAMNPTLRPSNIVLVDLRKSGHAFEEGLHLLRYGDGMAVRRLQRSPDGSVVLSCDNPVYETLRLTRDEFEEKVEIIGRVIWFGRKP